MDHLKRVADEFARQAQNFDNWGRKLTIPAARRGAWRCASRQIARRRLRTGRRYAALAPGASSVVAFDATEEMLEKAKARCAKAGLACRV